MSRLLENQNSLLLATKRGRLLAGYWLSAGRTATSSGSSIRQASAPVPDDRPRVPVGEAPQVSKWLRFRAILSVVMWVSSAGGVCRSHPPVTNAHNMPCGANILLEKCPYALLSCFLSIMDPLPSTLHSTRQPHLHCQHKQHKHLLKRGSRRAGRNSLLDTDVEAFTSASSSTPLHH